MSAVDKFLALARPPSATEKVLALAYPGMSSSDPVRELGAASMVRVPDYNRQSAKGGFERVRGYNRMGHAAMQQHLASAHGVGAAHFGDDAFSHPESLASWHGMDHLARPAVGHGHALEHVAGDHEEEHAASHAASHAFGGGEHGGHGFAGHLLTGGLLAHAGHEELRRTLDRQTRRRAYRMESRHLHGHHGPKGKAPGASGASGAAGGSGSGGSGSGGSGGSGGGSGSSGGSSGG